MNIISRILPVLWISIAIGVLTISSWIALPLEPVPITMQTAVVLLLGAQFGSRLGTLSVLVWLTLAFAGLPLLSDGKSGLAPFVGSTAGFLVSFPIACWFAGLLPKGAGFSATWKRFVGANLLHALILGMGFFWLSRALGVADAWAYGVWPFLPGVLVKSALVAVLAGLLPRFGPAR